MVNWQSNGAFAPPNQENALANFRAWGADMPGKFKGAFPAQNFERLRVPANIAEQMKAVMKTGGFNGMHDNPEFMDYLKNSFASGGLDPEIQAQLLAMRPQNMLRSDGMNALAGLSAPTATQAQQRPNWGQLLRNPNTSAFIGGV